MDLIQHRFNIIERLMLVANIVRENGLTTKERFGNYLGVSLALSSGHLLNS